MEYVELVSKCIFFYLIIIISLRVMGKREVGELSVLDIVIYFVMSEVYALSISEPDQSIWKALIAILSLTVLQIIIAWACLKKKKWRDFFEGKPSLIIYNGMIDQMEMLARPAELRAIMVTVGPTLSEVMATAPLTASSSYWDTMPE